jgi:DNA-binding IclR family transcriptional regulator
LVDGRRSANCSTGFSEKAKFGNVNDTDGSGVKSAERALSILELFSRPNRALTFTQVAELLGYPRSSLHGLLRTLTDRGWLRLDPASRRFTLGLRAWEAGKAYRPANELRRAVEPVVKQLRSTLDGAVHVSVLDDGDAVAVLHSDEDDGRRVGAHAVSCGRVLLAHLDRAQVEQRVAGRVESPADDLHRDLEQVRDRGWAEGDGEQLDGARTIAVPLRDRNGAVVAALAVTAPPHRLEGAGREQALDAMRQAADTLAAALEPAGR